MPEKELPDAPKPHFTTGEKRLFLVIVLIFIALIALLLLRVTPVG